MKTARATTSKLIDKFIGKIKSEKILVDGDDMNIPVTLLNRLPKTKSNKRSSLERKNIYQPDLIDSMNMEFSHFSRKASLLFQKRYSTGEKDNKANPRNVLSHNENYNSNFILPKRNDKLGNQDTRFNNYHNMRKIFSKIDNEKIGFQNIINLLSKKLREYYSDKKQFMDIFEDIYKNNLNLLKITDSLFCYRYELGKMLSEIFSKNKQILSNIFIECYSLDNEARKAIQENQIETKKTTEFMQNTIN